MKKITAFLMSLILITSMIMLTGCRNDEEDLSVKIEEKIIAYETDLKDSAETLTSTKKITEYLSNWAESKGVACTVDKNDNVIMSVSSSKEYKQASPTVIICPYDSIQFSNCIDPMAMAMYIAKNNENTGKLTVIFTKDTGHDFSGIKKLSGKYITDDSNVFCLSKGENNMWSLTTGARSSYQFSNSVEYTSPTLDKAYRIKIEGLPGGMPNSRISSYPNAVKELGDLLAYFKTNALIYQLAHISGGTSANLYPKLASAIVVIDQDDVEKFQTRMDTAIETFNDDYLEDYPDATYTYEEVDMPDYVFSEDSMNEFVSLMYTLLDGVYFRDDDDEIVSIASVGAIKEIDGQYNILATGNSLTEISMSNISNDYNTICSLSDVNYKRTDSQKLWSGDAESQFANSVAAAFRTYSGKTIEFKDNVSASNASYIKEINEKAGIISVSVNEDRLERYTGTIVTYLINLPHSE